MTHCLDQNGINGMDGATAQRGANAARGSGKPQDLGGVIDCEKSEQGVGAGGRDEAA